MEIHEHALRRLLGYQVGEPSGVACGPHLVTQITRRAGDAAGEDQIIGEQVTQHDVPPVDQIASGPRSPVRMRMQSSRGRMKILPSPMRPSGPVRPASMMALTVGSAKSSLTAICNCTLRSRVTVSSWPR